MTGILVFLLWLAAMAILVPGMVLFVECVCASTRGDAPAETGPCPRIAVVVPAHDEEGGIAATVASLRADLPANGRLLVVADNCADRTAELALAAGAEVTERHDPARHGKGYALAFAAQHLAAAPPEVVVVVDADCRISAGGLEQLALLAGRSGRPAQAEYLLTLPPRPDSRSAISGLAFLVRNQVRPRGMHRLGLPCQLTGSGMAFPWPLFRDAPPLHANLVEDLLLGLELALAGSPPVLCTTVAVSSALPEPGAAQLGQRRRWEHGHLSTLLGRGPGLLLAGLVRWRADLVAMALDLMVPPLALLTGAILGVTLAAAIAAAIGASAGPLLLCLISGALVLAAVLSAWWRFGRRLIPAHLLAGVPLYVLWKLPIYLAFIVRGRHRRWDRTSRSSRPAPDGVRRPE
jgi:cellulose synthase/poly-beta-1,6-N-acetylglucosamine synthase-like glycosyltransferase